MVLKYFRKFIQLFILVLWKSGSILPSFGPVQNVWLRKLLFWRGRYSSSSKKKFCDCYIVPNLKDLVTKYSDYDKWIKNLVNEEDEDKENEDGKDSDDNDKLNKDTVPLMTSFQDTLNCHQVKLDYQRLLYRACIKGNVATLDLVLENFGEEKTKQLLEDPPQSISKSSTPATVSSSESAGIFIKQSAIEDDNQSWPKLSAIHLAILFDHFSLITYLLSELKIKLSIDDQFDLNSLMFGALVNDRCSSVRSYDMILRAYLYGVDVNEQNREGYTALHFAVKRNNFHSVKLLLRLGADPTLVNFVGQTAADLARKNGNKSIYRFLVQGVDSKEKLKLSWLQHILWSFRLFRTFPNYRIYVFCILVGSVFTSFELLLCFGYLLPLYLTEYLIQMSDLFWTNLAMLIALFSVTVTAFVTYYSDPGYFERKTPEYVETLKYFIKNRFVYPSMTNNVDNSKEISTVSKQSTAEVNNIVDNCGDNRHTNEAMIVSVEQQQQELDTSQSKLTTLEGGDNQSKCSKLFKPLISARKRLLKIFDEDRHFCHICESVVSIDWSISKHCYICNRCVARFDHHCVFLFNCIGANNFATFVWFNLLFAYVGLSGAAILAIGIQRKLAYPNEDHFPAGYLPLPYEISWNTFSSLEEFGNFMMLVPYRDFFNMLIMIKFCVLCTILASASLVRRYWINR